MQATYFIECLTNCNCSLFPHNQTCLKHFWWCVLPMLSDREVHTFSLLHYCDDSLITWLRWHPPDLFIVKVLFPLVTNMQSVIGTKPCDYIFVRQQHFTQWFYCLLMILTWIRYCIGGYKTVIFFFYYSSYIFISWHFS